MRNFIEMSQTRVQIREKMGKKWRCCFKSMDFRSQPKVPDLVDAIPTSLAVYSRILVDVREYKREQKLLRIFAEAGVALGPGRRIDSGTTVELRALLEALTGWVRGELSTENEVLFELFAEHSKTMTFRVDATEFERMLKDLAPSLPKAEHGKLWIQMHGRKHGVVAFADFAAWYERFGDEGPIADSVQERASRWFSFADFLRAKPLEAAYAEAAAPELRMAARGLVALIDRHLRLQDERDLVDVLAPRRPLELRWSIGPPNTWSRILRGLGYTARQFNPDDLAQPIHRRTPQAKWIGFHKGDVKLHVLMRWECHDKCAFFGMMRDAGPDAPIAQYLLETCLSLEEYVKKSGINVPRPRIPRNNSQNAVSLSDKLWFLKLSNVDNGYGVRPFYGPLPLKELKGMVEGARKSAATPKDRPPRRIGPNLIVQRAVPSLILSAAGHKQDLRVYVTCSSAKHHPAFVYRAVGLRSGMNK